MSFAIELQAKLEQVDALKLMCERVDKDDFFLQRNP